MKKIGFIAVALATVLLVGCTPTPEPEPIPEPVPEPEPVPQEPEISEEELLSSATKAAENAKTMLFAGSKNIPIPKNSFRLMHTICKKIPAKILTAGFMKDAIKPNS